MFLQYYMFALLKVALLIALPPYLLGMIAGWKKKRDADKLARNLAIAYVLLIELFVLVEKGAPFFFSNLYFMFSLLPKVGLQYLIGIVGLILWIGLAVHQARNGVDRMKTWMKKEGRAA